MLKICLFLNGEFQTSQFHVQVRTQFFEPYLPNTITQNAPLIFAADGGLNFLLKKKYSFANLCWVGDRDSLNNQSERFLNEQHNFLVEQIPLDKKKDFSDLAVILDAILKRYSHNPIFLEIFAGLGGRRDHEEANKREIERFLVALPKGGVAYFHGDIILTNLPVKFLKSTCRIFTIFARTGEVEIKGADYSGRFCLDRPSHGLSNLRTSPVLSINPFGSLISIYFEE